MAGTQPDPVAAYLDDLRSRNEAFGEGAADVPRLLKALSAVLAQADLWAKAAVEMGAKAERLAAADLPGGATRWAAEADSYSTCAKRIRKAISGALLAGED